jgi:hypothetical protein
MSISKEALQYVVDLGNNELEELNGQTFSRHPLHLMKEAVSEPINLRSLSGTVQYLKSNFDGEHNLLVHVVSPTEVVILSNFNTNFNRNKFIKATALLPEFSFGRWYNTEEFIINLQAGFVPSGDRNTLLKVVGNIKEENIQSFGDDGVSQAVTAKTGVATVDTVKVPNPVVLKPFRTFVEVDQPESEFIFRMRTGPSAALFEADGGAWKLAAMQNIKAYLEDELTDEIATGRLVIIA